MVGQVERSNVGKLPMIVRTLTRGADCAMLQKSTLLSVRRHPFKAPSGDFVTSRDVVDLVNQLGTDYSLGSFDKVDGYCWVYTLRARKTHHVFLIL